MTLAILPSLGRVDAGEWDALAAHAGLYLSHRWLLAEESDPTATARYLLVRDGGRLVAAAPAYLVHQEPNDNYEPDRHRPSGATPAPGSPGRPLPRPRLLAGARRGYLNAPLLAPDLPAPAAAEALTLLRDALRDEAAAHGTTHWWPYLTRQGADLLAPLYPVRPHHLEDDATIPLAGACFDDYLSALPAKRRSGVAKERAAFRVSGLSTGQQPLARCAEETGRLLAELQRGHGHAATDDAMVELLRRQAAGMGDAAQVTAVRRGAELVAFSLCYHFAGTTWLRAVGVDRSLGRETGAYFTCAYYLPIEQAYANGSRALHVGMKSLEAKRVRGARTDPLFTLLDQPPGTAS